MCGSISRLGLEKGDDHTYGDVAPWPGFVPRDNVVVYCNVDSSHAHLAL